MQHKFEQKLDVAASGKKSQCVPEVGQHGRLQRALCPLLMQELVGAILCELQPSRASREASVPLLQKCHNRGIHKHFLPAVLCGMLPHMRTPWWSALLSIVVHTSTGHLTQGGGGCKNFLLLGFQFREPLQHLQLPVAQHILQTFRRLIVQDTSCGLISQQTSSAVTNVFGRLRCMRLR